MVGFGRNGRSPLRQGGTNVHKETWGGAFRKLGREGYTVQQGQEASVHFNTILQVHTTVCVR